MDKPNSLSFGGFKESVPISMTQEEFKSIYILI
jgi:hypothetical protein